ncbi:hypothetical protein ACLOJK_029228 [Asimina triloba]
MSRRLAIGDRVAMDRCWRFVLVAMVDRGWDQPRFGAGRLMSDHDLPGWVLLDRTRIRFGGDLWWLISTIELGLAIPMFVIRWICVAAYSLDLGLKMQLRAAGPAMLTRHCLPCSMGVAGEMLDRSYLLPLTPWTTVPRWVLGSLDDRAIWPWTLFGMPLLLPNSCALPCSMKADVDTLLLGVRWEGLLQRDGCTNYAIWGSAIDELIGHCWSDSSVLMPHPGGRRWSPRSMDGDAKLAGVARS